MARILEHEGGMKRASFMSRGSSEQTQHTGPEGLPRPLCPSILPIARDGPRTPGLPRTEAALDLSG